MLPASSMLWKRPEHSWVADAENVGLSDRRWVNAWRSTGKRRRHRREDLVRDPGIAPVVDDLYPNALLYDDGAVPEIDPEEVAVGRAVPNRPRRRKFVPLNGRGRTARKAPVANRPTL